MKMSELKVQDYIEVLNEALSELSKRFISVRYENNLLSFSYFSKSGFIRTEYFRPDEIDKLIQRCFDVLKVSRKKLESIVSVKLKEEVLIR